MDYPPFDHTIPPSSVPPSFRQEVPSKKKPQKKKGWTFKQPEVKNNYVDIDDDDDEYEEEDDDDEEENLFGSTVALLRLRMAPRIEMDESLAQAIVVRANSRPLFTALFYLIYQRVQSLFFRIRNSLLSLLFSFHHIPSFFLSLSDPSIHSRVCST